MSVASKIKDAIAPDDRQQKHRAVRRDIAECELGEQKQAEVRDTIARVDARLDAAVATHAQKTQPIQAELLDLEAKMLSSIADRVDVDPQIGERRARLLSDLDAANGELELIATAERSTRAKLVEKLQGLQVGSTPRVVFENKLCNLEFAKPELFDRHHAIMLVLDYLRHATEAAAAKVQRNHTYGNDDPANDPTYARRRALWTATRDYCQSESARLRAELAALRAAMLAE